MEGLQTKALTEFEFKSEKPGAFRAVVATYNVVDKDGDVTVPGALDTDKPVIVSPWNHSSAKEGTDPPVGYATITTVGNQAIAEGRFLMDTPDGKAAYTTTKTLLEVGVDVGWSYSFKIPPGGASRDRSDLEQYGPSAIQLLKKTVPFEVSSVFMGAGEGTGTISVKSYLESKVGARLSKESRERLRSLASDLLAFVGEAQEEAEPKVETPKSDHTDVEIQSFLRTAREDLERRNSTRLFDLRFI